MEMLLYVNIIIILFEYTIYNIIIFNYIIYILYTLKRIEIQNFLNKAVYWDPEAGYDLPKVMKRERRTHTLPRTE